MDSLRSDPFRAPAGTKRAPLPKRARPSPMDALGYIASSYPRTLEPLGPREANMVETLRQIAADRANPNAVTVTAPRTPTLRNGLRDMGATISDMAARAPDAAAMMAVQAPGVLAKAPGAAAQMAAQAPGAAAQLAAQAPGAAYGLVNELTFAPIMRNVERYDRVRNLSYGDPEMAVENARGGTGDLLFGAMNVGGVGALARSAGAAAGLGGGVSRQAARMARQVSPGSAPPVVEGARPAAAPAAAAGKQTAGYGHAGQIIEQLPNGRFAARTVPQAPSNIDPLALARLDPTFDFKGAARFRPVPLTPRPEGPVGFGENGLQAPVPTPPRGPMQGGGALPERVPLNRPDAPPPVASAMRAPLPMRAGNSSLDRRLPMVEGRGPVIGDPVDPMRRVRRGVGSTVDDAEYRLNSQSPMGADVDSKLKAARDFALGGGVAGGGIGAVANPQDPFAGALQGAAIGAVGLPAARTAGVLGKAALTGARDAMAMAPRTGPGFEKAKAAVLQKLEASGMSPDSLRQVSGRISQARSLDELNALLREPGMRNVSPVKRGEVPPSALGTVAVGGGLLANSGEARAQERSEAALQESPALTQARAELSALTEEYRALSAPVDANNPEAVRALQARLNVPQDTRYGAETREELKKKLQYIRERQAFAEKQIADLQQAEEKQRVTQMLRRTTVSPEDQAMRELATVGAGVGGLIFAKTGLPLPRGLPDIGKYSGAGGRAGNVYAVEQRLMRNQAAANAINLPKRGNVKDNETAIERAAALNQYWTLGGAPPKKVPFLMGQGPMPQPNPKALEAPELFRPRNFNAGDATAIASAGLETSLSTVALEDAKKKLKEADAILKDTLESHPAYESRATRVQQLRDEVTFFQGLQRAGLGYIGGRLTSGMERPGYKLPPQDYTVAQNQQGRLANYLGGAPAAAPAARAAAPAAPVNIDRLADQIKLLTGNDVRGKTATDTALNIYNLSKSDREVEKLVEKLRKTSGGAP